MIAFISGHRDVTQSEFEEHYVPEIIRAVNSGHSFVVGDYQGVDIIAQKYLKSLGFNNVVVYHMFVAPRNNAGFPTIGGFTSDEERDSAMTKISHYDIAWVREGKETSGTAQNIQRRSNLNNQ